MLEGLVKRAAIYARISDDTEGLALGVTRQIKDGQELAARKGWQVIEPLYVDNDISATRGKARPEYERLLRDMDSGRVQAVIVWALDRLHRRPVELEHFMDLAERRGVLLASVAGDIDLSTGDGQFHARIMGAVAAKEARAIGGRIRRKQQQLREEGKSFSGGIRAYGYDKHRATVIPEEAAEIRRMVDLLLSGHSLGFIVRDLNDRAVPTVSQWMATQERKGNKPPIVGKPWSRTSVRTLLTKPRLAGQLTYKGEVIGPGVWEPILDEATFQKVQVALSQRSPHHASATARRYLLSGIVTCGDCGRGLQVGHHGRGGAKSYVRYRCPTQKHGGRNVRALDEYVINCLFDLLDVLKVADVPEAQDDPTVEIESLRHRLNEAADQFADDAITAEQLARITARLRERMAGLEERLPSPGARSLLDWYFGTDCREQARREWEGLDLSQRRLILATHLGGGRIAVNKVAFRNHGLDTSTIDVLWKVGEPVSR
jgi:site-specific DNA recombinase